MSARKSKSMSVAEARGGFSKVVARAADAKERVVVTRRGRPVAAVVPVEDVVLLEEIEDRLDAEEARKALAEWEASGRKSTPLETVAREFGIKL